MILHLIRYDPKFSKSVARFFETICPENNVFVVVKTMKHQTNTLEGDFHYVSCPDELRHIVEGRSDWEGVVVNGLLAELWPYRDIIPSELPKGHFIWGVEAYRGIVSRPGQLLEPETAKLVVTAKQKFRFMMHLLSGRLARMQRRTKHIGQLFDFVAFSIKEEVDLFIREGIFTDTIDYVPASISGGMNYNDGLLDHTCHGKGVFVGNCASPNNNHIDAFHWIRQQSVLNDYKVVVPLSYGGTVKYREKVVEVGLQLFGNKFMPIMDFLPIDEYSRIIAQCDYMVMNLKRQQALGNIRRAVAMGATVCLRSETSVAKGMTAAGIRIRQIDSAPNSLKLLDEAERHANAALCRKLYGLESGASAVRSMVEKMTQTKRLSQ
jgi:hypothetical protein